MTKTNIQNTVESVPVTATETNVINGNTKYWVKNLCNWLVGCQRATTVGDISIPAKGKILLTDEEIRGQIFNNNVLFVGEHGDGSHARVYVEDKNFRVDVGFETASTNQMIIDDKALGEIFKIDKFSTFKNTVEDKIQTDGEKQSLISYAKEHKINDYEKITFMEEYTGYKF